MAEPRKRPTLASGGALWGPRRIALDVSLEELSEATGIPKPYLSQFEGGRMNPSAEETEKVMDALAARTNPPA